MSDFKIDTTQLKRLERSLSSAKVDYKKGVKRFLKEVGVRIQGLARKYAPESPTKSDYAKLNKSGKTNRKNTGITTGSLRDSITYDAGRDMVSINVPSNSRGGKYAERIHDKKGTEWNNRGPRTVKKGAKADEKYIYRAFDDSEKSIDKLIDKVIDDLTGAIGV